MISIRVKLKTNEDKLASVETIEDCGKWLLLLHEPFDYIKINNYKKKDKFVINSKLELLKWVEKHGK